MHPHRGVARGGRLRARSRNGEYGLAGHEWRADRSSDLRADYPRVLQDSERSMKDKHIVGGAQPTELDNHEVRQILSDATHGLESEGYKLLAFVVWQPDSEETGGYFNIIVKDRKSTRLNSSHQIISYAVFCLKKKKKKKKKSTHT